MLYLDYAASTPLRPGALEVLMTSMKEDFANPSSAHRLGREIQKRIDTCRNSFMQLVGASKGDRFIFTGSATESNNTIIEGIDLKPGDSVMVSFADHPSVTTPMEYLQARGCRIIEIPLLPNGVPDEPAFFDLMNESVKLVILAHVNNQSGAIVDVSRLSREIKARIPHSHVHVDAAQSFGKIPLVFKSGPMDSLSISSHKIGGPKGIAALVLKESIMIKSLLVGGGQEGGLRASTQAAPLMFSFYHASAEAMEQIDSSFQLVTRLNHLARACLKEKIPTLRFPFEQTASPYILSFIFPGISSDILLRHLEQQDILISSTSACSSKLKGANPVFTALHIPEKEHKFVLRASFCHESTEEDVYSFCNAMGEINQKLRQYIK